MMSRRGVLSIGLVGVLSPMSAADVVIAGEFFPCEAFADTVVSVAGPFVFYGPAGGTIPGSAAEALVGGDVSTGLALLGVSTGHVELGFTDNVAVNVPGPDIVLFEISAVGDTEAFTVSLGDGLPGVVVPTVYTGVDLMLDASTGDFGLVSGLNRGELDLSDLGVAPGASVPSIFIDLALPELTDLVAVAAVPAPSTGAALLATGSIVASRRRR